MKESNIDVKALSSAYKEKKKMCDDSNVVKIGKMDGLLDEVEHDNKNYQGLGLCYLPKPEADNTNRSLDNSHYHVKTESNNCCIIHIPEQMFNVLFE